MSFKFEEKDVLRTLNANHIYNREQIQKYTKFSRFGYFDPYNINTINKEYLFFTKMDLHLFTPRTQTLNPELANRPFFQNCYNTHINVMNQLQLSTHMPTNSPFCNMLTNSVRSNLDLQDISIDKIETASNIDGIRLEYPLTTSISNNIYDFTLEFSDNKYLDSYMFFRIWYEYELLKSKGLVTPPDRSYIVNRILHDQMSIYKFIVGEDMETIIHWSKLWGVYPTNIPRSVFSELDDGPFRIPVSFNCQWVEDMDPLIITDFNQLVQDQLQIYPDIKNVYDPVIGGANGEWCNVPYIISSTSRGRNIYKLKWR